MVWASANCYVLNNTGSIRSQQRAQIRPNVVKKGSVVNEIHLAADKIKVLSLKELIDLTAVQFLDDKSLPLDRNVRHLASSLPSKPKWQHELSLNVSGTHSPACARSLS